MTAPRRRLVRATPAAPLPADQQRRLQKLRGQLDQERAVLARWLTRLKRAFHTVERSQARLRRLERQIARLGP
jgi:hypothetical protein